MYFSRLLKGALTTFIFGLPSHLLAAITVSSPNEKITLTIDVQNNKPVYSVKKNGRNVITASKLGVEYGGEEYFEFDAYRDEKLEEISDNYYLAHGKKSEYVNHCWQQTVTFTNSQNGKELGLVFRVYDDAVAFRYIKNDGGKNITWDNEQSEFNFSGFQKCWVQKSYDAGYSDYYEGRTWNDIQKTTYQGQQYGYCVPMLVQTTYPDSWCLLTESAALSTLAASTIVKGSKTGSVKLEIVKHGKILGGQETPCVISTPFESPWRTIVIGSLAQIVESTVTQNLSPETPEGDWSWAKAGRVAWNWAAEDSPDYISPEMARKYSDMAVHFGWEYNLLDDGWQNHVNIKQEAQYCKSKGVGLLLWFNQSHFQNSYTSIYTEMKKYADMGVKGFKIDFFEDDRQEQLVKYERMLRAAKALKMVINFHGCTKPSGLDRMYPNLLTMEANYGGEMYMFWPHFTPANHVVNLCFTRNVLGSMDYTPLKWGCSNNSIRSIDNNTWGQELAMVVAFETGLFHPSDTPENLAYSVADPLLKNLPVAWDDVKCIEAQMDQYVSIARRKGENWWVATMANNARTAHISTDYLEDGVEYYAHIYRDGDYRYEVKSEIRAGITKGMTLDIPVLKYGGAIVIFTTDKNMSFPHDRTYEAEFYNQGGTIESDNRLFGGKYVSGLNATNKLVFTDVVAQQDGEYAVTLYFRANSATTAYVQANDGEKVQMSMVQPGVAPKNHPGENIGFRTALVTLKKGLNTLTIGNDFGDATPMVDHITVRPTDFHPAQAGDLMTVDGKGFLNAITIEGESGEGDGTIETDNLCHGGKRLNNLTTGKKRTYTITVDKAGVYDFNVSYMTGANRSLEISANGKTVKIMCTSTGSWNGSQIKIATASLYLKAGENTFTLGNATDNAPNIDKIDVALAAADGEETAISSVSQQMRNIGKIYNLQGLEQKSVRKGVYIINGKKYVR